MILIDTHIFIWLASNDSNLKESFRTVLENETEIAISVISCWEIAKLVENGRLQFNIPVEDWLNKAIAFTNAIILPLDIPIIIDSTTLPGSFHKDPADQLIVATSRIMGIPLMTEDEKIPQYSNVIVYR